MEYTHSSHEPDARRSARRRSTDTRAGLQRDPALRGVAPRQLPRRPGELREAAGRVRDDLRHRRPPRAHDGPRRRRAAAADPRDGPRPARRRPRPGALRADPPVRLPRARRAGVDLQHRHPGQLGRAHADLQGEAAAGHREQPRSPRLPDPPGGRHRHLQGQSRAGRQGPGGASRAEPRDRSRLQPSLRRRSFPSQSPSSPMHRPSSASTARRR